MAVFFLLPRVSPCIEQEDPMIIRHTIEPADMQLKRHRNRGDSAQGGTN